MANGGRPDFRIVLGVKTYAAVVDLCDRLAGRLSDTVLDAVRVYYFVGEDELAESTMLLGLAFEGVAITGEEQDLIRSVLDDPDNPDLDDVAVVDELPPVGYHFSPTGPSNAPDPAAADELLSTEAERHACRGLRRAWRTTEQDGGTWLYVAEVATGADPLRAYSGLSSQLAVELRAAWPVEVVVEGRQPSPYQDAALAATCRVWRA